MPSPQSIPAANSAPEVPRSGTRAVRRLPLLKVAALLEQQRSLTAVERFAEHDAHADTGERLYRDLIPLTRPKPGEQYAFEVNLDSCTGCKACVTACHTLNGLDVGEVFRATGLLRANTSTGAALQTVTSSCHHCLDPACLTGCPVKAYEKDPLTGIVRHLDDQCFGCQYCTLMCPYDAPQYNAAKGIVRKCDMCSDRLAHDQAPACVEACPSSAIAIRNVESVTVAPRLEAIGFLPGVADPAQTLPTTTYTSRHSLEQFSPVDEARSQPQPAHASLVLMLTLTQLAAGTAALGWLLQRSLGMSPAAGAASADLVAASAGIGVVASLFHLGRPWLAHRAVLGLRTSWLSREAVALGLFAACAGLSALVAGSALALLTAVCGLIGVACSVMVYAVTKRAHWALPHTALRFVGGSALLGAAALLALTSLPSGASFTPAEQALTAFLLLGSIGKLGYDRARFVRPAARDFSSSARMVRLMRGVFRSLSQARAAALLVGGAVLPAVLSVWPASGGTRTLVSALGLGLVLVAELLDRYLFFAAAPPSRMPGSLR